LPAEEIGRVRRGGIAVAKLLHGKKLSSDAHLSEGIAKKNEKEIEDVMERLRQSTVGRDAITLLVVRLIELRHPEKRVEFVSDSEIKVIDLNGKSGSIFLENIWAWCETPSEDRAEIVDRYVRVLVSNSDATELVSAENVVPLVRDTVYRTFVKEADSDLITRHLIGDLWIVHAVDLPESTKILTGEQAMKLGLDNEGLLRAGIRNVERLLTQLEFSPYGECFSIACENISYASSTLLLDYVWDQAANLISDGVVVAVPARDTVLFTGATNTQGLREIREATDHVVTNGHHTITSTLLKRVTGNWKLLL
jgi:uncharacterized protein YtpQ (UPF0354 family)